MKNYNDVVKDRFDKHISEENSIYSPNHPIGKYSTKVFFSELDSFLDKFFADQKKKSTLKLLDVGCGSGGVLSYFISKNFQVPNLFGIDLSKTRIENAKKKLGNVTLIHADIVSFELVEKEFDIITAFDVFSHLSSEKELLQAIHQIKKHLSKEGLFLWYDIFSKDHYNTPAGADSWGFNPEQMIKLAKHNGLELVYQKKLFKHFFSRYHSIYQAKRLPTFILKLLEKILPGTPGNLLMVFKLKT